MKTKILVPVSGGKDSTSCLILAIWIHGVENITAVFNDTGWDHPVTYDYLEYLESSLGIKVYSTIGADRADGKPGRTLIELIRSQGRFPFGRGRFCTSHLKQRALRNWYRDNLYDGVTNYEFWYGMRSSENVQRGKKYKGITHNDLFDMNDLFPGTYNKKLRSTIEVRLPVVDWSTDGIFGFLKLADINRNPLYYEGTNDRVGCYPCLLAGKKIQKAIFSTKIGRERLIVIKKLEEELGQKYEMFDTDQGSCESCKI